MVGVGTQSIAGAQPAFCYFIDQFTLNQNKLAEEPLRILLLDFIYCRGSDCCIPFGVHRAQSLRLYLNLPLVAPSGFRVNQRRFKVTCQLSDWRIIGPKLPVVVIDIVKPLMCLLLDLSDPWTMAYYVRFLTYRIVGANSTYAKCYLTHNCDIYEYTIYLIF